MSRATDIIDEGVRRAQARANQGGDNANGMPMTGEEAVKLVRAAFDAYITDDIEPLFQEMKNRIDRLEEKTEVLDGSRNVKALPKAAVRYQDFRTLRRFESQASVTAVSSAPTADQFNALRADVQRILVVFSDLSVTIASRSE